MVCDLAERFSWSPSVELKGTIYDMKFSGLHVCLVIQTDEALLR